MRKTSETVLNVLFFRVYTVFIFITKLNNISTLEAIFNFFMVAHVHFFTIPYFFDMPFLRSVLNICGHIHVNTPQKKA